MALIFGGTFTFMLFALLASKTDMDLINHLHWKRKFCYLHLNNWRRKLAPHLVEKLDYLDQLNKKLCQEQGIKEVPLYFSRFNADNASAYQAEDSSYILFGSVLLRKLDKHALGAILAHEIYHIKQKHLAKFRRIDFMFFAFESILFFSLLFLLEEPDSSLPLGDFSLICFNIYLAVVLLKICLKFIFEKLAHYFKMIVSKRFELEADLFAANNTNPLYYNSIALFFKKSDKRQVSKLDRFLNESHPAWDARIKFVSKRAS